MFEINGKAEIIPLPNTDGVRDISKEVNKLNAKAEVVAERIEREVRKHMPPYVSVQANIQFENGSLILTGTVALLSWVGSIVFDAAKEEVELQFSSLIKASVQRVINQVFSSEGLYGAISPIDMTVTPRGPSSGSLFARGHTPQIEGAQPVPRQAVNPPASPDTPLLYKWLIAAVLFLFLIQLLLVLDRFFEIRPKSGSQVSAPKV